VIGHICDLMMAEQSWVIRRLAVKTGNWFSRTEVQTPASQVGWASHEEYRQRSCI
jgi:hypothetical protein